MKFTAQVLAISLLCVGAATASPGSKLFARDDLPHCNDPTNCSKNDQTFYASGPECQDNCFAAERDGGALCKAPCEIKFGVGKDAPNQYYCGDC